MSAECVVCGREMADTAYACPLCASLAAENLSRVVQLAPEALNVAYGLSGRPEGGGSGKPGSRSPGNDDAMDVLAEVRNTLGTWVRHVVEERGVQPAHLPDGHDVIAPSARFLGGQMEWLRHRQEADEAFRDFGEAANRLRYVVDGPAPKRYLGPCGALVLTPEPWEPGMPASAECDGDVYGVVGGSKGTCRTCGAQVAQDERRAWLDDEVRQYAYTAPEIAAAYPIKRNTINQWASRGRLVAHDTDGNGRGRYNLGDVLDLAAQDAARRAERESERARRAVA